MTGVCNNIRDSEIKQHFRATEGVYKLEYITNIHQGTLNLKHAKSPLPKVTFLPHSGNKDKIIFNLARDVYVLNASDLPQLDSDKSFQGKHSFKDKYPTCHDVNLITRSKENLQLIIGTTDGQVHLLNPIKWDFVKIFNEDYCVEPCDSSVTGVRWVPGSESEFLASYSSGNMYLFNTGHYTRTSNASGDTNVTFNLTKQGDSYNILAYRGKGRSKEIIKWELRCGVIHEFAFSSDLKHLAVVSQDGFLRVFDFHTQDMVAAMRSYFGGLLCVCWSPDGRYIVTGGEDDLVTVWSLRDHKIIARGEGHKSWVTMVAFDPYTIKGVLSNGRSTEDHSGDEEWVAYRFGSVGQDAHVFLWDLCEESLEAVTKWRGSNKVDCRQSAPESQCSLLNSANYSSFTLPLKSSAGKKVGSSNKVSDSAATLPHRNKLSKLRSFVRHSHSDSHLSESQLLRNIQCFTILDTIKVPRMYEVPRLDPLVCKRVATERLTCLVFTKDSFILVCNEGLIQTWARPHVSMA